MTYQKTYRIQLFCFFSLLIIGMLISQGSACSCSHARFGLDRYNRAFVPSMQLYSIMVLDANGNRMARIGRYGNPDCKGPGSLVPEPDLGFAWVRGVAVSDKAFYAEDYTNMRVVKAGLTYKTSVFLNLDGTPATTVSGTESFRNRFVLHQNSPNPFNPVTNIAYELPTNSPVTITVLDLNGRIIDKLINGEQQSGKHTLRLDASRYPSGIYLYELKAGNNVMRKRMALIH